MERIPRNEEERDVLWCLRLFTLLSFKGQWIVPQNGLVFTKAGLNPPTLRLTRAHKTAPDHPELKGRKLRDYQRKEYELFVDKFGKAGIRIEGGDVIPKS